MTLPRNLVRSLTGLVIFGVMAAAITSLWMRYQVEPVTRDGKIRADTVAIAPDVAGLVTDVRVHDNERVHAGQILFVIDPSRYRLAVMQAEGQVAGDQASLAQAEREDRRDRSMSDVVATETIEQGRTHVEALRADLTQATSARDLARVNLERTLVRAPVDGTITNLNLQPGLWLAAGKPALELVYDHSLRAEGYFEETKLPAVRVGDPASIYIMGVSDEVRGHIESIAGGVEDRERTGSDSQLANVNPSFTWVRLAQRIPVRVAIDHVPAGVQLLSGQTTTVVIHPRADGRTVHRSLPW